ncbi:MAG: Ribosomal RNA small subunit methyltransferase E [Gammaproteobacteria bacterium]|nr:Ribosomal RNA small subunit methyltransferase E [Gammaproteobacteria bacterium]
MRTPRVHVASPPAAGASMTLDAEAAHHVTTVLRLRADDPICLFHDGVECQGLVESVGRRAVTVRLGDCRPVSRESPLAITLAQGISRGERMDYTIQKAVELGVAAIAPLVTERTTVKLDGVRAARRAEHWHRVIVNACEQCGRNRLPELLPVTELHDWLVPPREGAKLLLRGDAELPWSAIQPESRVTLLIGPEGGLAPTEAALAEAAGYTAVRMGPRILRTETAALAAIAALQSGHGDW